MSNTPCVLIVDDEPALVRVLVRLLQREGITAVGAANGIEALEHVARVRFDLILCDVRMPVLDGPSTLRALRERFVEAPPVVFLTGYADATDTTLLSLGACAVYGKPIEAETVHEIVKTWARSSKAA